MQEEGEGSAAQLHAYTGRGAGRQATVPSGVSPLLPSRVYLTAASVVCGGTIQGGLILYD